MACSCCGAPRFRASDEKAKGAKWLERGRPVELVVVPENTYITSRPMFWDGEGRFLEDFTVYLCGPRKSRAAAHFAYFVWERVTPPRLQDITGLVYPNLRRAETLDLEKQRALCDFMILEFTNRLNRSRRCEAVCECVDVHCTTTEWAKGPNWEALFVTVVLSRDLEDAHMYIDDQQHPIT